MRKRGVLTIAATDLMVVAGLLAAPAAAQTGTVSGFIANANGGAPLAGVRVELYDTAGIFTGFSSPPSHADGSYTIAAVPPGEYFVRTAGPRTLVDKVYDGSAGVACLGCNPVTTAGAIPITVLASESRTDTNFALLSTGRIIGGGATSSANSYATIFLEVPGQNAVATQPFTLGGWAVDQGASTGTGIDAIVVWAFPASGEAARLIGAADYGLLRPEVGGSLGDPGFNDSGFSITVDRVMLPTGGSYDLVVFGRSAVTNGFTVARVVRVNVQ